MSARYSPGDIPVVVTPRGIVVLAADTSPTLVSRIWVQVGAGRGLAAVLEALTGAYGTSLSAIPPFAVVLAEGDSVRLAVRGDIAVDIEMSTESERVSGTGVTTWSERVLTDVTRVLVEAARRPRPPTSRSPTGSCSPRSWSGVPAIGPSPSPWNAPKSPSTRRAIDVEEPAAEEQARVPSRRRGPRSRATSEDEPEHGAEPRTEQLAAIPVPPIASRAASELASSRPSPALIDSAAVLSLIDADTLLPAESTFTVRRDDAPADAEPDPPTTPAAAGADEELGHTVVRGGPPQPLPRGGGRSRRRDDLAGPGAGHCAAATRPRRPRRSHPPRPPAPGRLRVSTGQVVPLNRTVVLGRRPRSTRITGTDLPHLIAVESPQQDISRSHVELRVEGDSIIATDLNTTNGTVLLRAGSDPVRLHPGEGTVVVPGDVLDLGDGITVAVEDLA